MQMLISHLPNFKKKLSGGHWVRVNHQIADLHFYFLVTKFFIFTREP